MGESANEKTLGKIHVENFLKPAYTKRILIYSVYTILHKIYGELMSEIGRKYYQIIDETILNKINSQAHQNMHQQFPDCQNLVNAKKFATFKDVLTIQNIHYTQLVAKCDKIYISELEWSMFNFYLDKISRRM